MIRSKPMNLVFRVGAWAAGIALLAGPSSARAESSSAPEAVQFVRDVVPVLTKVGCNAGACHGSFQGRGGFRLSLLGFDPRADYDALVKEARGRRVFPAAPEKSLMLLKPTLAVPHAGGKRLEHDSDAYRILHDWIVQGLPGPRAEEPTVLRLEATPNDSLLDPLQSVSLRVNAAWSNGETRDVSPWALYESRDDQVAAVSPSGVVQARQGGRTAVTVRYMGQVAAVSVTVPFARPTDYPAVPRNNFIDDFLVADWKKVGLLPAPLADDAEFLRRAYLDIIGTMPTPDEIRGFLSSTDPAKRAKVIDALLERPEYVEYWSLRWSDQLRAHRRALGEKGLWSFYAWIRQTLRENSPADRMVRTLLTSQGNLYTNGPAAFFFVDKTPQELAETATQVFLGVRLQCARCHHHPFEVWSQDDYYGMAAFFARVERKDTGDSGRFGGAQSLRLAGTGRLSHPTTGEPVAPRALGQPPVTVGKAQDARESLAAWITGRENPYFARNLANRYWGHFLGRGLVDPVDDLRATNPASNPAVLDALARDFVEHGYDLKHLIRTIASSRTYHLAGRIARRGSGENPSGETKEQAAARLDGTFFIRHLPRRLEAEVLLDAIDHATGTVERFTGLPPGTRAISLPDPAVDSPFLDSFGRSRRTSTCECERDDTLSLVQFLQLINSTSITQKLTAPDGRVARVLKENKPQQEVIDEFYLVTLSRSPTPAESARCRELLARVPSQKEGYEDLLWALMNCAEFVFNH